jgi:hypothetical protein
MCAEGVQDVAQLREDLMAFYRPINSQELFALERMALAQASVLRAALLEASLFTTVLNEAVADPRVSTSKTSWLAKPPRATTEAI